MLMNRQNFPIQCLVISWVLLAIGFGLGTKIDPMFFSRFGSIVVLLGIMSEYSLIKIELATLYKTLKGQGAAVAGNRGISDLTPDNWHQKQALLAHITIVTGTLVWGFGDLFIK